MLLRLLFLTGAFFLTFQPILSHSQTSPPPADELIFVIRIDDILSRSVIEPRDIRTIEEVAEGRGARLTWAVIPHRLIEPQNADGTLANELAETTARGHEVALHGYLHICDRCGQSSHEMYCSRDDVPFTLAQQSKLIDDGHELLVDLASVSPRAFVPPGHVYDQTTLDVLADRGYDVFSVPGHHADHIHPGVFNVEPSYEYTWALRPDSYRDALTSALADIREADGYFQLLMHDPFTRPGYENGLTLQWMGELLDSLNLEYAGVIRYETLSGAADEIRSRQTVGTQPDLPLAASIRVESIYPNPMSEVGTFRIRPGGPSELRVSVYDATGRRIFFEEMRVDAADIAEFTIDMTAFPPGVYIYRFASDAQPSAFGSFIVAR